MTIGEMYDIKVILYEQLPTAGILTNSFSRCKEFIVQSLKLNNYPMRGSYFGVDKYFTVRVGLRRAGRGCHRGLHQ